MTVVNEGSSERLGTILDSVRGLGSTLGERALVAERVDAFNACERCFAAGSPPTTGVRA